MPSPNAFWFLHESIDRAHAARESTAISPCQKCRPKPNDDKQNHSEAGVSFSSKTEHCFLESPYRVEHSAHQNTLIEIFAQLAVLCLMQAQVHALVAPLLDNDPGLLHVFETTLKDEKFGAHVEWLQHAAKKNYRRLNYDLLHR